MILLKLFIYAPGFSISFVTFTDFVFFINVTLLGFVQLNPPVFDESVAADLWVGGACTCWPVASSARFKKTM